jgi:hypothetical protein
MFPEDGLERTGHRIIMTRMFAYMNKCVCVYVCVCVHAHTRTQARMLVLGWGWVGGVALVLS